MKLRGISFINSSVSSWTTTKLPEDLLCQYDWLFRAEGRSSSPERSEQSRQRYRPIKTHFAYPIYHAARSTSCISPSRYTDQLVAINSPLKSARDKTTRLAHESYSRCQGLKPRVNKKPCHLSGLPRFSAPLPRIFLLHYVNYIASILPRDSYVQSSKNVRSSRLFYFLPLKISLWWPPTVGLWKIVRSSRAQIAKL